MVSILEGCDLNYPYKIFICDNHDACQYGAKIGGLDKVVFVIEKLINIFNDTTKRAES